jgi:hypothetical protein
VSLWYKAATNMLILFKHSKNCHKRTLYSHRSIYYYALLKFDVSTALFNIDICGSPCCSLSTLLYPTLHNSNLLYSSLLCSSSLLYSTILPFPFLCSPLLCSSKVTLCLGLQEHLHIQAFALMSPSAGGWRRGPGWELQTMPQLRCEPTFHMNHMVIRYVLDTC